MKFFSPFVVLDWIGHRFITIKVDFHLFVSGRPKMSGHLFYRHLKKLTYHSAGHNFWYNNKTAPWHWNEQCWWQIILEQIAFYLTWQCNTKSCWRVIDIIKVQNVRLFFGVKRHYIFWQSKKAFVKVLRKCNWIILFPAKTHIFYRIFI